MSKRLSLPALVCSIALLLCELISRPWAEMGVSDDWSYIRSAQLLAQTGHIHYVGWASAILGWQLYLGAAFIKLFGFSFTAARLPTLLIALLTAYLMQRTLVRFGITQANAVLGTLTFVLSPLFMPLSATMMTDVPGFFAILACIYGCIRALQAPRDRDAILWLAFAIALNDICGTSRQIAWLGVLVLVPSTLWLLRSRRTVLLYGLALTALGYLFVFATLHWFSLQPYALPEPVSLAPFHVWAWKLVITEYIKALLEISLLLFPLTLPFLAASRHFSRRNLVGLAALAAISIAFVYYLGRKAAFLSLLNPFIGDWIGPRILFNGALINSAPPIILTALFLKLLSFVVIAAMLCIATTILMARPTNPESNPVNRLSWSQLSWLFGPFLFAFFVLHSRHSLYWFFDRYLFAPMFIAMVCILLYSQQHLKERWRGASYVMVAVIAFYGVLSTHNLFALQRARVLLAKELLDAGVSPTQVDFGWEMNGWYELQRSAYINEPHILRPAGAYLAIPDLNLPGCHENKFPESGLFLHLAPRYGISFEPNLCDGPAPFAPVSYSTWPLRQPTYLYVVKYPPPWLSPIDIANQGPPSGKK